MAARGPQNSRRGLESGLPQGFLALNKFFDQCIPSMRNVDDGEKKQDTRKKNGENSGPLTSLPVNRLNSDRLQHRPLVPLQ